MSNLHSVIDQLSVLDPEQLTATELSDLLVETSTELTRLAAVRTRLVRSFHRPGPVEFDGHLSTTSWLTDRCRLSGGEAADTVRISKALGEMPATDAAFSDGAIGVPAVRILAKAAGAHPEVFRDHEATLVGSARRLSVKSLGEAVGYWRQALDWEAVAAENEALYERRNLHVSCTYEGMVRIDGDLDPESGEIVSTALAAATPPAVAGEGSSPSQRRADALTQICRSYLDRADAPSTGGMRPHLNVIVDLQVLEDRAPGISETTRGTVLDPETVRRSGVRRCGVPSRSSMVLRRRWRWAAPPG